MHILTEEERKTYMHPLLVDGTRYLLNKNPFEYAIEAVEKYWSMKVYYRAGEICWEKFHETGEAPTVDDCVALAARELSTEFVADESFLDYYKQDGFDMIPDPEQFRMKEEPERCEYKKLSELKLRSFSGETSDLRNAEAKASVFQEVSYEKEAGGFER